MNGARIICGDVREALQRLPPESAHCVVTSPPYWGLRDYGLPPSVWGGDSSCAHEWGALIEKKAGGGQPGEKVRWQHTGEGPSGHPGANAGAFCSRCGAWRGCLGLEPTFDLYIEHMVEVFADVHRVLRPDGTLWLNLGDCYATGAGAVGECLGGGEQGARWAGTGGTRGDGKPALNGRSEPMERRKGYRGDRPASGKHGATAGDVQVGPMTQPNRMPQPGLKPKDLVGIPWRVAFALQADGWWLRSDVIWSKPNPMPESINDRPTKAHEYLFLLSKSERYFYDKDAIAEASVEEASGNDQRKFRGEFGGAPDDVARSHQGFSVPWQGTTRNRRSVWTICTQPFPGAHFAVMPEALVEPCILAGTSENGACEKCGAPWERETSVEYENPGNRTTNGPRSMERRHETAGFPVRLEKRTTTTGWSPSCDCGEQQTRPCVVLDPFAGSGTVGVVALKRGRGFVGIELNPKYAELARDRIHGDAPLLNRAEVQTA